MLWLPSVPRWQIAGEGNTVKHQAHGHHSSRGCVFVAKASPSALHCEGPGGGQRRGKMPLKRFILAWCGRKLLTALVYCEFNVLIITGESQFVLVSDSTRNYQAIPLRCKGGGEGEVIKGVFN